MIEKILHGALVVAVLLTPVWLIWRRSAALGRDQCRIRQWADSQGYAVLQIRRSLSLQEMATRALGCGFLPVTRGYEVQVQDDQGGQFTVEISINGSRHFETRRL